MSGIGGWLDTGHSAMENQQIIDHMARLLARFDSNPAQITVQGNAALSVVAKTSHAHLYEKEGLLVGIWGRIKSENEHVQATINAQGMAAALADLWRQKGEKLLSDFAGEFVCCIVDKQAHKVILAIDPLGTHTLYYQLLNNGILFGSSADALLVHPQADQTIHPQGLLNYLYFHMIPGPGTIYQAQQRLLPGEYLYFNNGRLEITRYTQFKFDENARRPFPELQQEFVSLLKKSVSEAIQDQKRERF